MFANAFAAELPPSNVVGVVVLSKDATIGGVPMLSGQNITAESDVEVKEGAAELTTSDGTQLILGPNTGLSLRREGLGTAIQLNRGNLTFAQTRRGNGLSIRVGNVSVFAQPSATARAVMTMTNQSLLIATREGSIVVDRDGRPLSVPIGETVRFEPDRGGSGTTAGSTQSGATPSQSGAGPGRSGAGGTSWGRVAICSLGGAAVGSVPVIVNEQSTSPDPDWRLGLIPVGAVGGGLICKEFWESPGASCTLVANRRQVNEGEAVTLSWRAPPGYHAVLTDVGDEPPVGKATVTPQGEGTHNYQLKATGPAGTLVCMADVKVDPKEAEKKENEKDQCGVDITNNLKDGIKLLKAKFDKLSEDDKKTLCTRLLINKWMMLRAWDIGTLINDEPKEKLTNGGCGKGKCANSVTVNGTCQWAPAVNYILFGSACKLCIDANLTQTFRSGFSLWLMEHTRPMFPPNFSFETIQKLISEYRSAKAALDQGGMTDQIAWAKVGWTGDWKEMPGTSKDYKDCAPCPKKPKKGQALQWNVGRDRDKEIPAIIEFYDTDPLPK